MSTITEQAAINLAFPDVPGFKGQGWSTQETMMIVRWLLADPEAWDQAMAMAREYPGNPHTVADTLHERIVPRPELDAIAAAGGDPAKVNWLEIAHELIERRDDPLPAQGHTGISGQAVGLAADAVTVAPEAMKPPGLPVPDDPAAISIFTAHRINTILHQVAHATERMQAAQAAGGDLRQYHVTHIVKHLGRALDSAHEMTDNLREHYPAEAAELEQVKTVIGLSGQVDLTTASVKAHDTASATARATRERDSRGRFYHATPFVFKPGDLITPGHQKVSGTVGRASVPDTDPPKVYFTDDAVGANIFHSNVYEVEPTGDVAPDKHFPPSPGSPGSWPPPYKAGETPQGMAYESEQPLRVVSVVKQSKARGNQRHPIIPGYTGYGPDGTSTPPAGMPALAATISGQLDLAKAVSPTAKAVTTAHLLETTLHELTHAQRHAQAMGADDPGGVEWAFDADHCASHLAGAVEHAEKIFIHVHDNYPAEAKWLTGIAKITHPLEAQQHTGDDTTISGQLDLAAIHGRHIPGSAYTFRHGWIPLIGKQLVDKYPQWKIDEGKAGVRKATVRETKHADKIGKGHIKAAKEAVITVSGKRQLTRDQQAMIAVRDRSPAEIPSRIAPAPSGAAAAAAAAFQDLLPPLPPAAPGPTSIGSMHQQLQPQTIGGLHQQMAARDPALSALAGPGASEDALAKFIDARVATEVARQMGQITPRQSADVKDALAKMHGQQQKLIALIRHQHTAAADDDTTTMRKHTIANTLFAIVGVGIVAGGIATGMGPIALAVAGGLAPLANVIHDYARNLK